MVYSNIALNFRTSFLVRILCVRMLLNTIKIFHKQLKQFSYEKYVTKVEIIVGVYRLLIHILLSCTSSIKQRICKHQQILKLARTWNFLRLSYCTGKLKVISCAVELNIDRMQYAQLHESKCRS